MKLFDSLNTLAIKIGAEATRLKLGMLATVYDVILPRVPEVMAALQMTTADGATKKAAALQFLGELYDQHIATIDLPGPIDRLLHKVAKRYMLYLAGKAIEQWFTFLTSAAAKRVVEAFQPSGPVAA
jgi:hypothetical protein